MSGHDLRYISHEDLDGACGFSPSQDTNPSIGMVLRWVEEIEREVDVEKEWGKELIQDELIDVEFSPGISVQALALAGGDVFKSSEYSGRIVYPSKTYIVSVKACHVNEAEPDATPDWQSRVEAEGGGSSGADYQLLKRMVFHKERGVALRFIDNAPPMGVQKVRLTYENGLDLDSSLLREYVRKRLTLKVLEQQAMSNTGASLVASASTGTLYNSLRQWVKDREKELPPPSRMISRSAVLR